MKRHNNDLILTYGNILDKLQGNQLVSNETTESYVKQINFYQINLNVSLSFCILHLEKVNFVRKLFQD